MSGARRAPRRPRAQVALDKPIDGVRAVESLVYHDIHTHRFDWDVP